MRDPAFELHATLKAEREARESVTISRAQHEAYKAAAKALMLVIKSSSGENWNSAVRALAAIRAAGIQMEDKT
jgi:hypothetical protein